MIEVKNLNKTYDRRSRNANHVLKDVSFTLPQTGFVCILGPSGCGKTSLLNAIGGLDRFDSGTLSTGSVSVKRYGTALYEAERNRDFGYIFQNYYLLDTHSVAYNVYLGLHSLELSHREKLQRVRQALEAVDMDRYIRRRVSDLSGGQQQRVAIARALARKPRVIFADEPTGNLDEANTRNICTLLRKVSRDSLVVMVTHEAHIARFFADRIITLDGGVIVKDETGWNREDLLLDTQSALYAGDYSQRNISENGLQLQLLRQEGAPPVKLTVVATAESIVIKLSDSRIITQSTYEEAPVIMPGNRPKVSLEELEQEALHTGLFQAPPARQCRAGKGLRFSMMLRQALELMKGKGLRRAGLRIFLILLTVLTLYVTADLIAISNIDPEDFITTDSHILTLTVEPGTTLREDGGFASDSKRDYVDHLKTSGLDFDLVPSYATAPEFTLPLFHQMEDIQLQFPVFSYASLRRLDESTLIYGRLPQAAHEIVIDRQILEAATDADGIVEKSISDISYFLNKSLSYYHKAFPITIVGICDSGERTLYMSDTAMVRTGSGGLQMMSLSEARELCPEIDWDQYALTRENCLMNVSVAGVIWNHRIGDPYVATSFTRYTVLDTVEAPQLTASVIVADDQIQRILADMQMTRITLYCADKDAMRAFIAKGSELQEKGYISHVYVQDQYQQTYDAYVEATTVRADGRTIIIATVLALSLAMLYLLCRAQTMERIGMLAVYRLLGIPGRKAAAIFAMESILTCLQTALPAALLTWAAIQAASRIQELQLQLMLPWQAACLVLASIAGYYLLVCLIPAWRLLRLPPAQLAAKYDI